MFTLSAIPVKFVCLLVMFLVASAYEALALARSKGAAVVSHGFHLLMGLVMLAMVPRSVWKPLTAVVPVWVFTLLMALGVAWFTWQAIAAGKGHRRHASECAVMFLAMVWHLAAMMTKMHAMKSKGSMGSMGKDHAMSSGMDPMWWIALVGVPIMAWLVYAGVRDLVRAIRSSEHRLSNLSGFCMNFGMFWMSTGLMVALLPFFTYFSF